VFSPVIKMPTLRIAICIANQLRMKMSIMDVTTAFLDGQIEKGQEIFMNQPPGFESKNKVCKLNKSIYGLRSSSRQWNKCLHDFLVSKGFQRSKNDLCLYVRKVESNVIYMLLYVDDILMFYNNDDDFQNFKEKFSSKFKVTDLSDSNKFIGVNLEWSADKVTLSQKEYILKVLRKFRMNGCNPVKTPMETNLKIEKCSNPNLKTNKPYRELLGCLNYIAVSTRPDITYAVNHLSQFQENPTEEMYAYAKRVLRYLGATIDKKLTFVRSYDSLSVSGYVDADFGGDINDRKSRSGFLFMLGKNCISWGGQINRPVSLCLRRSQNTSHFLRQSQRDCGSNYYLTIYIYRFPIL
jgi:hypothetical protein